MASSAASMASRCRVGPTPTAGSGAPPRSRGSRRASRSMPAVRGQVVAGVDHPLGDLREGVVDRPGAQHLRRHQRHRQGLVAAAVLGLELLDEQGLVQPAVLGEPVVGLEDRDGGAGASVGVARQGDDPGRRRVGVDRAHLVAGAGGDAAHRLALEPQRAARPLARRVLVPRLRRPRPTRRGTRRRPPASRRPAAAAARSGPATPACPRGRGRAPTRRPGPRPAARPSARAA